MNIKPGDVYAQLGKIKRFHMFVFVKEYKGRMLFFDIHTGELFLLTYKTIEKALETNTYHPVHRDLKMFDYSYARILTKGSMSEGIFKRYGFRDIYDEFGDLIVDDVDYERIKLQYL